MCHCPDHSMGASAGSRQCRGQPAVHRGPDEIRGKEGERDHHHDVTLAAGFTLTRGAADGPASHAATVRPDGRQAIVSVFGDAKVDRDSKLVKIRQLYAILRSSLRR